MTNQEMEELELANRMIASITPYPLKGTLLENVKSSLHFWGSYSGGGWEPHVEKVSIILINHLLFISKVLNRERTI